MRNLLAREPGALSSARRRWRGGPHREGQWPYADDARRRDQHTTHAIEALSPEQIGYEDACGRNPVCGALEVAKQNNMEVEALDLRNSGDTAGPRDRVVGYGAYAFYE